MSESKIEKQVWGPVERQLRSQALRKAVAKELSKADPFQRRSRGRDEEWQDVTSEADALCILDSLCEWPTETWMTQDGFDGILLGSLMPALGAKRVLAAQESLLAVSVTLFAIVYEHLVAARAA